MTLQLLALLSRKDGGEMSTCSSFSVTSLDTVPKCSIITAEKLRNIISIS